VVCVIKPDLLPLVPVAKLQPANIKDELASKCYSYFWFEQQVAEPARLLGFARNHTSKLTRRVAISCTPLRFLMLRYFACHLPQAQLLKLRIFRVPLALGNALMPFRGWMML
jgi:hypothetical protein